MRCASGLPLLLCAFCLASAFLNSASAEAGDSQVFVNRFGRALLSYESIPPSYLLPTRLSELCHGDNCCQEDDYTSAYQVMMLNSSQAVYGGRTYTTFFMNLQRSSSLGITCNTDIDTLGCCNADVRTIWIDVDPELKVVYTKLNEQRWITSTQDTEGFRLTITPQQHLDLPLSSIMSITVSGAVDQLCPLPDIAPVPGLCDVILEGDLPNHPKACCPRGLSRPSGIIGWVPPNDFTCVADQAVSPFNLAQAYVSNVYIGADGTEYVDYALNLTQNMGCREGPNSCCGMHLSNLELKVMKSAQITGLTINSGSQKYTTSDWNDVGDDAYLYNILSVANLEWPVEDIPRSGNLLVVTVKIPTDAVTVPQLCSPGDANALGTYGPCSFYFYSDDGYCCPSGATNMVAGPILPTTCNPTQEVPIADTSFGFMYYEYLSGPAQTDFTFVVTSNGAPTCGKTHCVDVCGWELAVNDNLVPHITFTSDNTATAQRTLVQRGPNAAIIFSFATGSDQTQYVIKTPTNTPLEQLCRANAHPDQGSYPCAATIRAGSMFAMVFFSQSELVIKTYPDVCPNGKPLSQSCLQPTTTRYNSPDSGTTVFDFQLTKLDPATGCTPVNDLSFQVILLPAPVGSLSSSNNVDPRDGVSFNMTTGVEWDATPTATNSIQNYMFRLDGVQPISQVCIQNLPGQPRDTCMVQFRSDDTCFHGFVSPVADPSLVWSPRYGTEKPPVKASVVVPAVVIPVVALLAGVLAVVFFVRRRRNAYAAVESEAGDGDNMHAPLTGGVEPSEASLDASDVQVRLPSSQRQ